ncbi:MarR family winged helix-turn-helix transcriptional regulator [Nisaea denitrificans]|uniref:MarR family winged helix-turn-helix transcriptional regulator n=1 Tax=Nisaea denitrificans TaxID=390877 RepID=UPI0005654B8B|nr:MarR family winged helix-turn-helix transcriptional regulator [Nisaea denitrificans]
MKSQESSADTSADPDQDQDQVTFSLDNFLPYRLALLSSLVSGSIQKLYASEFDISIPEWRLVAILGSDGPMTANDIRQRAAMDKVQVSRAAAKLLDAGHIRKQVDPEDKRRATLSLSDSGSKIYNQIVPIALEREAYLSSALSEKEKRDLIQLLEKLTKTAKSMTTAPPM